MKDREEITTGPESGAYTWLKSTSKAVADALTEERIEELSKTERERNEIIADLSERRSEWKDEDTPVSSIYNLLDHSELDLDIMVMILSHFLGTIEGSPNFDRSRPTAIAWVRIFEQARDQVKDRDMKAWASQQQGQGRSAPMPQKNRV